MSRIYSFWVPDCVSGVSQINPINVICGFAQVVQVKFGWLTRSILAWKAKLNLQLWIHTYKL